MTNQPITGSRSTSASAIRADGKIAASGLRILLVEDDRTNKLIASRKLEEAGYVVQVVENGRKAVRALEEEEFDLVLMDVYMPEMDGLEATRIIRRREAKGHRRIPIIAMTATDTVEQRGKCIGAGMDGFISKPVDPDELQQVLTPLLQTRAADLPPVNLVKALAALDWDMDLLHDVVRMFLDERTARLAALQEALARGDARCVENTAHQVQRILANVGGLAAYDLAQQLKTMGEENRLDEGLAVWEKLCAEVERVAAFFAESDWAQSAAKCEVG